jgi:hypothetical protein
VDEKTKKIAKLNDLFRRGVDLTLGLQHVTRGISDLPIMDQVQIFEKVLSFTDFCEDNNPHGERDFGAFEHGGEKVFWKIDYYDPT